MKRIIIISILVLLAGCATNNPPRSLVNDYSATHYSKAASGEMKWSDYYLGIYENIRAQPTPTSGSQMGVVNNLIEDAKDMESGKMSKDDFESKRRAATAELVQIDSDYQTKLVEIQASRPAPDPYAYQAPIRAKRPPLETFRAPRQTNCSTYGNQTNCTTY